MAERRSSVVGQLILLISLVALSGQAYSREKQLTLEELPAPIVSALEKAFPGCDIQKAERDIEQDLVVFEVQLLFQTKPYELKMTAEGSIVEAEEEVLFEELPLAVSQVLARSFSRAKIVSLEKVTTRDKVSFEVEMRFDSHPAELEFSSDGQVIKIEAEVDWKDDEQAVEDEDETEEDAEDEDDEAISVEDLPATVVQAAMTRFPEGSIIECEKEVVSGRVLFEMEIRSDGNTYELTLTPDGRIIGEEIEEEE